MVVANTWHTPLAGGLKFATQTSPLLNIQIPTVCYLLFQRKKPAGHESDSFDDSDSLPDVDDVHMPDER